MDWLKERSEMEGRAVWVKTYNQPPANLNSLNSIEGADGKKRTISLIFQSKIHEIYLFFLLNK